MPTPIHADHPKKKRIRHPFDVKTLMDTFDISAGAAATVLVIMGIVISVGIVYFIHLNLSVYTSEKKLKERINHK